MFKVIITLLFVTTITSVYANDMMLMKHNQERMMVGVPPLMWDDQLAMDSMNYAKMCKMEHSMTPNVGENLAWGMPFMSSDMAMNMWVGEKDNLIADGETCMEGKVCGHYLQIIKKRNIKVGCGMATCMDNYNMHVCRFTTMSSCKQMCKGKGIKCRNECRKRMKMDD